MSGRREGLGRLFGERLRHRRMELHLRQIDLAALLDEPQPRISRWECGRMESMSLARLRDLARVLHTSTDYLLGLTHEATPGA